MPLHRSLRPALALLAGALALPALATPVTYTLDSDHTYPSFEADHGGLSTWRGKFNKTAGTVVLDRAAQQGAVELVIQIDSIDFGHEEMNKHAKAADMFDAAKYPVASYKGRISRFRNGEPVEVQGDLTLRGVTRPVALTIERFKCVDPHPMNKVETCGADVYGRFNRRDFGLNFALDMGFSPEVLLRIQVEALKAP